jgi:hypothetical protein
MVFENRAPAVSPLARSGRTYAHTSGLPWWFGDPAQAAQGRPGRARMPLCLHQIKAIHQLRESTRKRAEPR